MRRHQCDSGLPDYFNAAYDGYTGKKNVEFPTNPHLDKYPDVTKEFLAFRNEILEPVKKLQKEGRHVKVWKYLAKHATTGATWDTKFHPDFPGRDEQGRVQYARYKGKVVSANYLSNNIYGQILATLGFPCWFAQWAGRLDARGVTEILFQHKWPPKELRKFRDTSEDQRAIGSGYDDALRSNPWRNSRIDPRQPYPVPA